jgi:hypothetical protein
MFNAVEEWHDGANRGVSRDCMQRCNKLMSFNGDPQHIDGLGEPRCDLDLGLDRILRPLEVQHSGIVGVSMRTNQDRHLLSLVGKGCSNQSADGAWSENGVFHEGISFFEITVSVQIRLRARQARRKR